VPLIRALDVARDDPFVLAHAAQALAYFGEDIGAMIALVDRALALNPNFARGWHLSGLLRQWAGDRDTAIEHFETALRLSPRHGVGPTLQNIGCAHFGARRFEEAVPKLLLAIQDDPGRPIAYRFLAASYAHMGRLDDARGVVERLRTSPLPYCRSLSCRLHLKVASCSCPVCGWRWARRHEPAPPPHRASLQPMCEARFDRTGLTESGKPTRPGSSVLLLRKVTFGATCDDPAAQGEGPLFLGEGTSLARPAVTGSRRFRALRAAAGKGSVRPEPVTRWMRRPRPPAILS
jgi:hypothetical protein